ncbi:thiamine-phosphate kinase [Sulfuracidifex tepidarius]|uniref:Thiamine-monophosphate kinase n=1 Tax=Sulfuracidifex tepidarius TaxID=1294262 RepID=A0A510DW87_9CREN|nr:AIR synthase related protein [Sulfuracidifex tepidarius]BBG24493.1 Thiamine-monophosphate kinase [Sulfuracidifex tepidarius]BBG27251.1 Thiamine-monophosphate kinase [Sulfuracidifex tepidarius]
MKLKDIGEHRYIEENVKKYLDIDNMDDVFFNDGSTFKVDGFSLSYKSEDMSFYDIGWKAAIATFSDLISAGSSPSFVMSSIGINHEMDDTVLEEILRGLSDCVSYYSARYVGGDLNNSPAGGWIDVVGIGKRRAYPTFEPKKGDLLVLTNPLGYTSLYFLSKFILKLELPQYLFLKALAKIRHPLVNKLILNVLSSLSGDLVYSTDVSDGLLISIDKISKRLNMGIEMSSFGIEENILNYLKAITPKIDLIDILRYSGEEFETIVVIHEEAKDRAIDLMRSFGLDPLVIGKLSESNDVTFNGNKVKITGWDNFRGWF